MAVDDPVRWLMERQLSGSATRAAPLNEHERRAVETARSILDADPGLGPVDVVYIDRDEDVLFQGEKGFLFDQAVVCR